MATAKEVTQAEFARLRGVSRKAVTKWKSRGLLVLTEAGLVDVKQTTAKLEDRPTMNRGGVTRPVPTKATGNRVKAAAAKKVEAPKLSILDQTAQGQAMTMGLTHADAARLKEVTLARLRMQELEIAQGKLVEIETVARLVEQEYAVVRERLLAIPGKLAAKLVDRTRSEIEAALLEEVTEALDELHDPDFEGSIEPGVAVAESASRAEAAAAVEPGRVG